MKRGVGNGHMMLHVLVAVGDGEYEKRCPAIWV